MEQLGRGLTLDIPPGCFPLSTDSMALAGFVRLGKNARVLDLGSGCGTLGLLLRARYGDCHVTGIECSPVAHAAAVENIRRNQMEPHMESICADLRNFPIPVGKFSAVVSNPPYFTGGDPGAAATARHTVSCSMEELFSAAARALQFGGDFFLVHKPEMLARLCACAVNTQLEPKKLCLLRHAPGRPIALVLLACRKGGKPGLAVQEWTLHDENGQPTPVYRQLYHL